MTHYLERWSNFFGVITILRGQIISVWKISSSISSFNLLCQLITTQKVSNSCELLPPCHRPWQKADKEEALHNSLMPSFTAIWNQRSLLTQNRCSWIPAQSVLYCCNSQRRLKEFYAVKLRSHKATFQIYFKSFIWNVFEIYHFKLIWNKSKTCTWFPAERKCWRLQQFRL